MQHSHRSEEGDRTTSSPATARDSDPPAQRCFFQVLGDFFPFLGAASPGDDDSVGPEGVESATEAATGATGVVAAADGADGRDGNDIGSGGFVANCVRFLIVFSGPQSATPPIPAAATTKTISPKKTSVCRPDRGGGGAPRRISGCADGVSIQSGVFWRARSSGKDVAFAAWPHPSDGWPAVGRFAGAPMGEA